jgi:large subunit ribosomal protein L9
MKVILLGELRGKGGEGDVVDVAQGYAENYLFPNRIAQPATPGNLKQLEERRAGIEKREAKRLADAHATKELLDGKSVTVEAKVGENDQLFGSITTAQIVAAIKDQLGVEVDRKRIGRGATIKTVGKHPVEVNLYRDINAVVTVLVGVSEEAEPEESEEDAQADETVAAETEAAAE